MNKVFKSKIAALVAFFLVIIVIILTFGLRPAWWAFIDLFFAFMAAFCHLVALYLGRMNPYIGKRMEMFALIFAVLTVLSFVGEYIAYTVIIP